MEKNLKFIILITAMFITSCGSLDNQDSSRKTSIGPFSEAQSDLKYNAMYNKIVLELMMHKNQHDEALNVFISNIDYFKNQSDFLNMINRARDLRRFNDIATITQRWLDIDSTNASAHKISFANYIEISDFVNADTHLNYLFSMYEKKKNKSYINIEDILSRNIIKNNIVRYFEENSIRLNNQDLLLSYINVLQKNNLDSIAVSYLKNMQYQTNRLLVRKYSNSLSKLNNIEEAITILESYIGSLSITDRETSFDLLALYLQTKNTEKIDSLIDKLISVDPDDNDFIFRVALLCFDKGHYSLSEKFFNILLSKSYASDNINFFLGQIDYINERYKEALLHYERIKQGTFVNTKLLNVSKAMMKQYDLDRASSYLDEEIKIKTKTDLLNLLSLKLSLYQEPYNVDRVIETSSKILKSFPTNERALYSRALAYEKKGDIEKMSIDFEVMIESNPYNSIALNAYGYSLSLHQYKLNYAEELIRRAIDIDPGNAAILDSLAWVLYLEGSYKAAHKYASLAYIKDRDPEIVMHYYMILLKNGYNDKARNILEQSLRDNPNNKDLLKLLDNDKNEAAQL